jgi:hypothetical protein
MPNRYAKEGAFSSGVAGATAGAAVGSVVPGIGTAIGAGLGFVAGGISGWMSGGAMDETNRKLRGKLDTRIADIEAWRDSGDIDTYIDELIGLGKEGRSLQADTSLSKLLNRAYNIEEGAATGAAGQNLVYGSAQRKAAQAREENQAMITDVFEDLEYRDMVSEFEGERERVDRFRGIEETLFEYETDKIKYT